MDITNVIVALVVTTGISLYLLGGPPTSPRRPGLFVTGVAIMVLMIVVPIGIGLHEDPDAVLDAVGSLGRIPPMDIADTAGAFALVIAVSFIAGTIRLRRTVTRHAARLTPLLADISDHIANHHPSQPAAPSTAVTRHLQTAADTPWWRSRTALLELRDGAVTATEDVRAVMRGVPQDEELGTRLRALVAVRGDILDTVRQHGAPIRRAPQHI